jgi:hypothetical protein
MQSRFDSRTRFPKTWFQIRIIWQSFWVYTKRGSIVRNLCHCKPSLLKFCFTDFGNLLACGGGFVSHLGGGGVNVGVSCGKVPQSSPFQRYKGAIDSNVEHSEQFIYRMLFITSTCGNWVANAWEHIVIGNQQDSNKLFPLIIYVTEVIRGRSIGGV